MYIGASLPSERVPVMVPLLLLFLESLFCIMWADVPLLAAPETGIIATVSTH